MTDKTFRSYVACALWSSTGDDGEPLDDTYTIDDISRATLATMRDDVDSFIKDNAALLEESGLSDEQIGHDFWLTRNGHGAGFWDRGLGKVGDALSDAAKVYSGVDLYEGDDGLIY